MVPPVRLSQVSREATAALASLDAGALIRLTECLEAAVAGRAKVEPEAVEVVSAAQHVFQHVLTATAQNIQVLQRLQNREAKAAWAR